MTQEIKPTYVTREQANRLKEKEFDLPTYAYYSGLNFYTGEYKNHSQTTIGDTPMHKMLIGYTSAPEQWQVVEWLRVNHEIEVYALRYTFSKGEFVGKKYMFVVEKYKKNFNPDLDEYHFEEEPLESSRELNYNSPQEAYSAAFDYILNNLI
jgi:hypothetical protein